MYQTSSHITLSNFEFRISNFESWLSAFDIRHSTFVLPILAVCILLPCSAFAQAWTLPKGHTYVKLFYGEVTAAEHYTFDGRPADYISGLAGDTFRDRSLYMYSEIGVSDHVSLVLTIPYKRTFVRDHAFRFRIFGFGSVKVGGRFSLFPWFGIESNHSVLAANVNLEVPTGYTRNYTPSVGSGQVNLESSLFFGHSSSTIPLYIQLGAGYRHRSAWYVFSRATPCRSGNDIECLSDTLPQLGDETVFHIETGLSPFGDWLLLQALVTGAWSIEKPDIGFSALYPIPTRQRFMKAGVGAGIYPFHKWDSPLFKTLGANIQFFQTPFGRNTIKSRDLFIGVELRTHIF